MAQLALYPEKEKYLKYTTLKEFYDLDVKDMNRITSKISGKAAKEYLNGEKNGIYTD